MKNIIKCVMTVSLSLLLILSLPSCNGNGGGNEGGESTAPVYGENVVDFDNIA